MGGIYSNAQMTEWGLGISTFFHHTLGQNQRMAESTHSNGLAVHFEKVDFLFVLGKFYLDV